MSRNYKFHNPHGVYFVSFAVVEWIDVFTRVEYKNIFLDTLRYAQRNKGMEIFAWCLMTSHTHLVFRSEGKVKPEEILKGIKCFSGRKLVEAIKENPRESRRDWLLERFAKAAKESSNVKNYQFWRHDNKPIELWSNKVISEKIRYIHQNPVEEGLVFYPEDYLYSSALDYAGKKGILEDVIVVDI